MNELTLWLMGYLAGSAAIGWIGWRLSLRLEAAQSRVRMLGALFWGLALSPWMVLLPRAEHVTTAHAALSSTPAITHGATLPESFAATRSLQTGSNTAIAVSLSTDQRPRSGTGWVWWLAGMLMMISALRALALFGSWLQSRALYRSATKLKLPDAVAAKLCAQRSDKLPDVFESAIAKVPQLVGLLRSRIILPQGASSALASDELAAIIAHECGHLERRDLFAVAMEQLALVPVAWNPGLIWLHGRLSEARESACDDWAVSHGASSASLARGLLRWRSCARPQLAVAVRSQRQRIEERLRYLKQTRNPRSRWAPTLMTLLGLSLAFTAIAFKGPSVEFTGLVAAAGNDEVLPPVNEHVLDPADYPLTQIELDWALGQLEPHLPPQMQGTLAVDRWENMWQILREDQITQLVYFTPHFESPDRIDQLRALVTRRPEVGGLDEARCGSFTVVGRQRVAWQDDWIDVRGDVNQRVVERIADRTRKTIADRTDIAESDVRIEQVGRHGWLRDGEFTSLTSELQVRVLVGEDRYLFNYRPAADLPATPANLRLQHVEPLGAADGVIAAAFADVAPPPREYSSPFTVPTDEALAEQLMADILTDNPTLAVATLAGVAQERAMDVLTTFRFHFEERAGGNSWIRHEVQCMKRDDEFEWRCNRSPAELYVELSAQEGRLIWQGNGDLPEEAAVLRLVGRASAAIREHPDLGFDNLEATIAYPACRSTGAAVCDSDAIVISLKGQAGSFQVFFADSALSRNDPTVTEIRASLITDLHRKAYRDWSARENVKNRTGATRGKDGR